MRIRRLAGDDLRPLYDACRPDEPFWRFRETWLRALARAERDQAVPVVAAVTGQPVGHAQLIFYPHVAEIADVAVAPDWRGRGFGRALVEVLLAIGRHLSLERVEIGVMADNEPALTLYRRLGFVPSREVRLARGAGRAIIMEHDLSAASGPGAP